MSTNAGYLPQRHVYIGLAALFTMAKLWKWPRCLPTNDWLVHNMVSFNHKESKIMSFLIRERGTQRERERIELVNYHC